MSKFKVGDVIIRIEGSNQPCMKKGNKYIIKECIDRKNYSSLVLEGCTGHFASWNFKLDNIFIEDNILTPPPMNYFHTAVLIATKPATTSATITSTEWIELEPYKVRTAYSREDLEKILLRELDKSVDHNDVKFLINPIF